MLLCYFMLFWAGLIFEVSDSETDDNHVILPPLSQEIF